MDISLDIARRYLFGKKKTNVINIINWISMVGLSIGTAALIIISAFFSGFEGMFLEMFSAFDPAVKVVPVEGKFFEMDADEIAKIEMLPEVETVARSIEEIAYFEYNDANCFGLIKGVDDNFGEVVRIDTAIKDGAFDTYFGKQSGGVVGATIFRELSINVDDPFSNINVFMVKKKVTGAVPYKKKVLTPTGVYTIQPEDDEYVITNLAFVQKIMSRKSTEIGALEIKQAKGFSVEQLKASLSKHLGDQYKVQTRLQQNEGLMKIMNIERWLGFAIVSLTVVLVLFNLIGSLWMIYIEKRPDIAILKSMGANDIMIRNVFLYQGLILAGIGIGIGFLLAILFYFAQIHFHFFMLPDFRPLPIAFEASQFAIAALTVLSFSILGSWIPAKMASKVKAV